MPLAMHEKWLIRLNFNLCLRIESKRKDVEVSKNIALNASQGILMSFSSTIVLDYKQPRDKMIDIHCT